MQKTILVCATRWLLLSALLATPCLAWAYDSPLQRIPVSNAEDLALTADGQWVIASSMAPAMQPGGALYLINTADGAARRLDSQTMADDRVGVAGCDAPVPATSLAPHGIALQTLASGDQRLFVINHGVRESAEIYQVTNGATPSLAWQGCIPLPPGALGNAVAVTADEQVYVTNLGKPTDGSESERRWMGNVIVWSVASGWQDLPGSNIYAPNGLLVADAGNTVYVASWAGGEVAKLTFNEEVAEPVRETIKLPFLPDNLRWSGNDTLLATGMRGTAQAVALCVQGAGPCDVPTAVATIEADKFHLSCVQDLSMSMGTVALPVGESLWVGRAHGESIWVLANTADARLRCDAK